MSNRNKILCEFKTCIYAILLQSDINKYRISKLDTLDKLYTNYVSTRLLHISYNDFIEYTNQIFPNNSHINLRACDAASSYHCPSPIIVSNISK